MSKYLKSSQWGTKETFHPNLCVAKISMICTSTNFALLRCVISRWLQLKASKSSHRQVIYDTVADGQKSFSLLTSSRYLLAVWSVLFYSAWSVANPAKGSSTSSSFQRSWWASSSSAWSSSWRWVSNIFFSQFCTPPLDFLPSGQFWFQLKKLHSIIFTRWANLNCFRVGYSKRSIMVGNRKSHISPISSLLKRQLIKVWLPITSLFCLTFAWQK